MLFDDELREDELRELPKRLPLEPKLLLPDRPLDRLPEPKLLLEFPNPPLRDPPDRLLFPKPPWFPKPPLFPNPPPPKPESLNPPVPPNWPESLLFRLLRDRERLDDVRMLLDRDERIELSPLDDKPPPEEVPPPLLLPVYGPPTIFGRFARASAMIFS